jgi:hypothetical protein
MSKPSTEFISPWDQPTLTPEPEPEPQDAEPLSTAEEISVWADRAHRLWHDAVASGDLRSAAMAMTVALRGLKSRIEREETEQKLFNPADRNLSEGQKEIFRRYLDGILREARAEQLAAREEENNGNGPSS